MTGFAVNLSSISAQSYILTLLHPKYSLYIGVVVASLFSIYQGKFALRKLKFARFSTHVMLGFAGFLALFTLANYFGLARDVQFAFAWLFIALAAADYFRWSLNELTMRHMDQASGSAHLSYVLIFYEVGSLVAASLIFFRVLGLEPKQITLISFVVQVGVAACYWLKFVPVANLEVRFTRKPAPLPDQLKHSAQVVLFPLLILAVFAGTSRSTEDYLIRLAATTYVNSVSGIHELMAQVYGFRGIIIIIASLAVGALTQRKRPSMLSILWIHLLSCFSMAAYCLLHPGLYSLLALSSVVRAFERSFYVPSLYLLTGAFVPPMRGRLRSLQHFSYFVVAGVAVALWVAFVGPLIEDVFEIKVMLSLFLIFAAGAMVALRVFSKKVVHELKSLSCSPHKPSAVLAVHLLSFLKPKDFLKNMEMILEGSPKPILRKTIIEGLGYCPHPAAVETILKEFHTDKEMIQISVLEALRVSKDHSGIQFILNVAMVKGASRTPQVRIRALQLLASFYGKKAIPLLLNGLHDQEDRIVANSLEELTLFKDRSLIPYFRKFSTSDVYRISVTAMVGLYFFSETRAEFRRSILAFLCSADVKQIASALYGIGFCKDSYFLPILESLLISKWSSHPSIKGTLAWALSSLRDPRGYDLFASYFDASTSIEDTQRILHLMGQLPRDIRFSLFRRMCTSEVHGQWSIASLTARLKNTHQDFHEEIDFIHELAA